ncbi:MAG TPA: hypothetical protein VJV79_25370 [Polyangiaceae bacterium]|nr:hypothetical protein [Polyangiaceae bacterium]
MSSGLKLLVPCALALYFAAACVPDLDSLSAEHSNAGSSGFGPAEGGMGNTGEGGAPVVNSCENKAKDSNESDVDCGGSSKCDRCATNAKCTTNSDCGTQYCKNKFCTEPTCTDGVRNQDETEIDCGGSCKPCDIGAKCTDNDDCDGQYCVDDKCADHCTSGVKESDETDKDCGGATCEKCADTLKCSAADDCQSLVCSNQKCSVPTCSDEVLNQDESDLDCGGACSGKGKACPVNARCNSEADCESWICSKAGKCVADILVAPENVLDDFEDGNTYLPADPALGMRVGNWYPFSDGTGTASFDVVGITRGQSLKGFITKGKEYKTWGSGVGVDMAPGKAPYNAGAYTGITFWARAETTEATQTVTVVFPDVDTDPGGKLCTSCDHHYNTGVSITPAWQRYTIKFSALVLETGTIPEPTMFKPGALISVQFRFAPGQAYEVYLDDIAFVN